MRKRNGAARYIVGVATLTLVPLASPGAAQQVAETSAQTAIAAPGAVSAKPLQAQPEARPALDLAAVWTNFIGLSVSGPADSEPRLGGRLDIYAIVDGGEIGLWDGLVVAIRPEFAYGSSVNEQGSGEILPINTALAFPEANDETFDLALTIGQRIGRSQLTVGKINTVDLKTRTPLLGGGGVDGFSSCNSQRRLPCSRRPRSWARCSLSRWRGLPSPLAHGIRAP